ncbi:ABC transporter permease [Anaerococcus hydrogenalis]|uniref:ABC transporter permease n=1 Tax=Anaerococcus hydrogenalis TaxID=33029 RepID=A0A2N6UKL3_9FIRM|nr:ABC transporter permease [Anaerococcus hydrogenalis]MDK7694360.1 ABC transporter permease [Anaerococcus hydrogenalis]MDK7696138.1 ABC transporter permease [Anaerococcus hydrogenalis]MDK7707387.1 ABC transporter permease [Anaerococcus hydrogenalis]PMC82403.1 ABC transporter permease [Anaerococcus hydrogenalis]
MNKKNFPIFISLFIVSLFFTIIFYFGYRSLRSNYGNYMASSFYHGEIKEELSNEDVEKLKSIEDIDLVGKMSLNPDNGKLADDLVVINYQDEAINKMREYSRLTRGRFAEKEDEIVLSESLVKKNKLTIGDKVKLNLGKRLLDGEEIGPTSANTDREKFEIKGSKSFTLVGVYGDVYNRYSKLSFALGLQDKMPTFRTFVKFHSFEEAYKNRDKIQSEINKILGKDVHLEFSKGLINYYGVENEPLQNIMSQAVLVLSVLGCIVIFVFFIKNIFWVWGLRKIRELSIYKSIGSTNGQIYLLLLKEGLIITAIPILLGHIAGFFFMYCLYKNITKGEGVSAFEVIKFNPLLSLAILFVSFVIVALAIKSPAKKISKINIIDGIRGNIDFSKSKKKRAKDFWKELKLNNLASIKSQRYISAIGIIIISVFIITIGISTYYRDYSSYDNGYNFSVDYFSEKNQVPKILNEIVDKIPNEKSYISKDKYVQVENNNEFSKEAKAAGLDEEARKNIKKYKAKGMDGFIIALEEKDLKKLGGKKGEFVLYNSIQEDSSIPIAQAKRIPYFENPQTLDINFENDYKKTIKIAKTITDLGKYKSKTRPFDVKVYTDFETFFKLMEDSGDEKNKNYAYTLNMKIKDSDTKDVKEYVEAMIRSKISPEDRFNITTGEETAKNEYNDLKSLIKIVIGIASIIFVLNITNGYSSINLSLMSRKKEIGSLYSCGMDVDELKNIYQKEFIGEQIKSFTISIIVSLGLMFVISLIASDLRMSTLIKYYDYKSFLGFSLVVYGINLIIYHFSLKRILDRPTIDLIRTI